MVVELVEPRDGDVIHCDGCVNLRVKRVIIAEL